MNTASEPTKKLIIPVGRPIAGANHTVRAARGLHQVYLPGARTGLGAVTKPIRDRPAWLAAAMTSATAR